MILNCTLSIIKAENFNGYREKVRKARIYEIKAFVMIDKQYIASEKRLQIK